MSLGRTNAVEMKSFITPSSSSSSGKFLQTDSSIDYDDCERMPLDSELPIELVSGKKSQMKKNSCATGQTIARSWRGPLRAIRLLILVAIVPSLFIFIPLYLRYNVFSGQLYPVGMSDMRLIDKKVSTTWCQRQVVRSNATFNAFLMSQSPQLSGDVIPVTMTRQLRLEDDMKEYWGFYLLEGSMVTVSTCVRWPGASLIMIRGHRHLKECAYIGDDSSEELEEILRANGGKLTNKTLQKLIDQPSNRPKNMTRHLSGVRFHEPRPPALKTNSDEEFHNQPHDEEKDVLDPKMLQHILAQLKETQNKYKKKRGPVVRPNYIVPVQKLTHRYRETNVNENEEKWLSFKDLEEPDNESENEDYLVNNNIKRVGDNYLQINQTGIEDMIAKRRIMDKFTVTDKENINVIDNKTDDAKFKFDRATDKIVIINGTDFQNKTNVEIASEKENTTSNQRPPAILEENYNISSSEVFDEIYNKLEMMGDKGKTVLERLNNRLTNLTNLESHNFPQVQTTFPTVEDIENVTNVEEVDSEEERADLKIETLKNLLTEVINEEIKSKRERKLKKKKENLDRLKRELFIEQKLEHILTEDDEKGNAAIEEEFEPDGIADHHVRLNESTLNDMSRSEFWSSFSSSEEALLECDGLILNLPLTPNKHCEASQDSINKHDSVSKANTVTYKVPTNGYYFFVFNSENEIQENYIRVKFDLKKTVYDLNNGKVMECTNLTGQCTIPLDFFSGEKVVFEMPVRDNDSLWNEDFVVISECEPRTLIYIFCVIAVPIFIIMMALH